jgi:hypothetical protein
MRNDISGCRQLIAAILEQAFVDAHSSSRADEPEGAIRFINKDNKLFVHYCHLINLDPEYMAQKMQEKIKKKRKKGKEKICYALDASTLIVM